MLIKLYESKLFTKDTALRFAENYHVSPKMWNEIWKRHLSGYDLESLAGYFIFKTGKKMSVRALRKWLIKTDIYCRANHVMLMGVRVVHSEYFAEYEGYVIDEVLRNMKYRGTQDARVIV